MKKNLLFGLLTILVAGFWFGGVSMAADYVASIDADSCDEEPATWCYLTLDWAFGAAANGNTIEILKWWEYTLPDNITVSNLTVKWAVEGVKFNHAVGTSKIISTIAWWITFENVEFVLTNTNNVTQHYFEADNVMFKNCTIRWLLYGYWTMEFNGCIFEQNVYAYNMWTWRWDITYNNCVFHNSYSSYFINVYHWLSDPNDRHTITVNSWTFITENEWTWAKVKSAVNIKEAENVGTTSVQALQFTVNLNDITTSWNFLQTGLWSSEKYQVDDILWATQKVDWLANSVSSGTLNWGDIIVNFDWVMVYSTPKRETNYTVTFDWDTENAIVIADWSKVSRPASDPTKEWYSFSWWYKWDALWNFDSVVTSLDVTSGSLALISKWKANQYTIIFNTDGWSAVAPITQDYWTTVTAPANPTKDWYTFAWWNTTIPATMPAYNLIIKAKWNAKSTWSTWWGGGSSYVSS